MRLATIISLAPDRRSGRVQGGDLLPADEAVTKVKQLITSGKPLDPRFPIVAAVAFSTLREHRFAVDAAELAAWKDGTVREATTDDLAAALKEAEARLTEAESAAKTAVEANESLKADNAALQARASAAEIRLTAVPADVAAAMARIDAIRAKLASVSDKINKTDILKLIEEVLTV